MPSGISSGRGDSPIRARDLGVLGELRGLKPPLDMFGADAVERWFTEKEVEDVVVFVSKLEV